MSFVAMIHCQFKMSKNISVIVSGFWCHTIGGGAACGEWIIENVVHVF